MPQGTTPEVGNGDEEQRCTTSTTYGDRHQNQRVEEAGSSVAVHTQLGHRRDQYRQ